LNTIQSKMTNQSNVKLMLAVSDPDAEELDKFTRNLLREMKDLDVESAELVAVEDIPEEAKAFGGFLIGRLTAEVNAKNIKAILGYLRDRLGSRPIELEVEANSKKLKVKASSQQELLIAIQAAEKFVA
ncbi:MAG: sugar ABC transporter permease, partial [Scytonema sp. PMC 1069.18]|nr:sugar ABC transporter permease [Scytonema sp. PMC 1069.18]